MESIDLIQSELIRVRDELKRSPESDLKALAVTSLKREYCIFGKKYPSVAWAELDDDGTINVIVEITKAHWLGTKSVYSQGFKYRDGSITNLSEQELWEFD